MSKISEKLDIINNAKNDIKTAIENKGISVGDVGIQEYASKINEMEVATPITKGLKIDKFDSDGFSTEVTTVGMTAIPNYYFYTYNDNGLFKNLTTLNLPNNLTSIGNYSFYGLRKLVLTSLPDTLSNIGEYAFYTCYNLRITSLPENITSIPDRAFYYCEGLNELTFYGDVTSIAGNVFNTCRSLKKLVFPNITSVPTLSNKNAFSNSGITTTTGSIYVPDALVTEMQNASNWSNFASRIKGVSEL